jgi:hypothetical protein
VLASIEQLRTVMSGSSDSIYQKLREIVPELRRNATAKADSMAIARERRILTV